MKLLSKFLFVLIFGICPPIYAQFSQPGELDTTFNLGKPHSFFADPNNPLPGQGANSSISTSLHQPDGKVLIGGNFTNYNGKAINHIARLNSNGSLDASFNPGTGAAGPPFPNVAALSVQPDGRILIGGNFTSYNGTNRNRIARLNSDGSLDVSFNPGTGANSDILSLVLQTDGKIIIGGGFTDFNGTAINRIARINADGSLDATFNPGTGTNATVLSLGLQPDGKIIVVGSFTSYNGGTINRIARLNADGSLDATFTPGTGANSTVRSLYLQPDGKIFIVGDFTTFNGTARNYITRLNSDGSLDATFDPGTGAISSIESLTLQPDGKLIIGGGFASYNGTTINFIARVDSDGSLDATFNPGTGANSTGTIRSLSLQPDGKILVGGAFTRFDGTAQSRITRLNPNGTVDATFNPDTGANGAAGPVRSIAIQPDGKMLIGGDFVSVNAKARRMIARLNVEGTLDATFDPGTGANSTVAVVALQPDGKILVGGGFTDFNGTAINRIVRLNANGTLDATFNPGTGANFPVLSIALQPDGKILIGGSFSTINGVSRNSIARLNADGSLDASFNPGTGALGIQYLALQPDGKVLIGGSFTSYNSTTQNRIARLNADGSLDATFNIGTGVNGVVFTLALQPDGKILIGGDLTSYNGTAVNDLARLNSDGSLDGTFNPGTGPAGIPFPSIRALTVQSDGKILIGGNFTSFNGTPRNHISRIDASGSLDATFNPGIGANSDIWSVALQPDGKILIGGNFTSYNNTGRSRIARILESPLAAIPTITSFTPNSGPIGTTVTISGTNFDPTLGNNLVQFNGTTATVTSATTTTLVVTVLAGTTNGPITVTVAGNTATSGSNFTVVPPSTILISPQPISTQVCDGVTTSFVIGASGTTNLLYQWQKFDGTVYANISDGGGYNGTATTTLSVNTSGNFGTGDYRCKVSGDFAPDAFSNVATLTVNPIPAPPQAPTPAAVCIGSTAPLIVSGSTNGNYRWYDGGTLITGEVNDTYTTPVLSSNRTFGVAIHDGTCESTIASVTATVQTCSPPVIATTIAAPFVPGIIRIDLTPLLSDPENNLDLTSIAIVSGLPSGATATLDGTDLVIDYGGMPFPGTETIVLRVCDITSQCTTETLTLNLSTEITIFNAISPNADGKNEVLFIENIDLLPETQQNKLTLFNRWGAEVFSAVNYNNTTNSFRGLGKNGEELPSGTYFYTLEFSSGAPKRTGFISLRK